MRRRVFADVLAICGLILLWLLFFWRFFTPFPEDRVSLKSGDFSGQFVAFGAYQYARFAEGEIPLWNPYNNGGLPFIADTQAAVFYPPRLLTIALSKAAGGWSYNALQLEMTAHVLLFSLFMYVFVRRLTWGQAGSIYGAFIAAVIMAYGGFTSAYPQLQLAILEAAIWLPLSALGIHEATRRQNLDWRWLIFAGWALGLSWMAGHPQTSWFMTYTVIAYWGFCAYGQRVGWRKALAGLLLIGAVTIGVTAVTLLPGIEYLTQTTRAGLSFDEKGNGFPFHDLAQILFPGSVSHWSPLYIGIPALILAGFALWKRASSSLFWGMLALVALAYSFGENSLVYHASYNILPGARFFRGQERAAFLFSTALAVLAGIGVPQFAAWKAEAAEKGLFHRTFLLLLALLGLVTLLVFVQWLADAERYGPAISIVFFSLMIGTALYIILRWGINRPEKMTPLGLLAALIVFELFSINLNNPNVDPKTAESQLDFTAPPLIAEVLKDSEGIFRVDGFRGVQDNYGSLYQVMDVRGISPLFLEGPHELIYQDYLDNPIAWELFAVKYIFSDRQAISVENEVIASGQDRQGEISLRQLSNPRPYALLLYQVDILDSDEFAYALLHDPNFDPRQSVILDRTPKITLPDEAPRQSRATVTQFLPEQMIIETDSAENAILSLAHPHYPGWNATLDGQPAEILRAYGALTAIEAPAGEHIIQLRYNPLSYRIGAVLSLVTWVGVGILGLAILARWSATVFRTGAGKG